MKMAVNEWEVRTMLVKNEETDVEGERGKLWGVGFPRLEGNFILLRCELFRYLRWEGERALYRKKNGNSMKV